MEHKLLEFFHPIVSHGFKSIVACVLVDKVGLNFYTVLDEASWKETRPFGARLSFGSMQDVLLLACVPLQWNARHTTRTRVSNTRKMETHVVERVSRYVPHTKILGPRSLSPHLANCRSHSLSHSAVVVETVAPPPSPIILDPGPRARRRLDPGLGACRRHPLPQALGHRTGKESPAYLDPQISTRTNLLVASSWKDVVAYFANAMRHYSDKEILVVPFNLGNHWVTIAISIKYSQVWCCDSARPTDSITGERLTCDWTDIMTVLDE
jgi:hypothetical protein